MRARGPTRRRSRHQETAELNVTAFMNLMVVLVPFLLVMAVFSRLTILELNLPTGDGAADNQPPDLQLEVIVRDDGILVADRQSGPIADPIERADGGYDLVRLSEILKRVKSEYPDKTAATILLEPDIPYEDVVSVMDAVRLAEVSQAGNLVKAELFPDISIGDAPREAES